MKASVHTIHEHFAAAYHQAALQDFDMTAVAARLEPMRRQWKETGDVLALRAALDTATGATYHQPQTAFWVALRDHFIPLLKNVWVEKIAALREQSEPEAWAFFLATYADCITRWRTRMLIWWVDTALGATPESGQTHWFSADKTAELQRMQAMARLMDHGRWVETYTFLHELSANTQLPDRLRAHLLGICASIQTYHIYNPDAPTDLDAARKLAPDLPYLTLCEADYERTERRIEQAKSLLDTYAQLYPGDPEGHIARGKIFQEQNLPEQALECYQQATNADPGNLAGYRQLIAFWSADKNLYEQHRSDIDLLVEKGAVVEPDDLNSLYSEAGYAALAADDFSSALKWLEKALDLDPERLSNQIAMGYCYQKMGQYDVAASFYHKAIELAPTAIDGYWNLSEMRTFEGKHAEAAEALEQALPRCPLYHRHINSRLCEHYTNAGMFDKALAAGLGCLRSDPQYNWALDALHALSDKCRNVGYDDKTGPEKALEVLDAVRELKGEKYEANYQNRRGNVYYYFSQYLEAAGHYKKAAAADPSVAVYFENLAGALERQAERNFSVELYKDASEAAAAALQASPDSAAYRQNKARLETEYARVRHFGVPSAWRSAHTAPITFRYKYELKPLFENNGYIVDPLYQKIKQLIDRIREQYGITIPPVVYMSDWNIVADANFVIDFDGIPIVQMSLSHSDAEFDNIARQLEHDLLQRLSDFVHFDTAEVSDKFVGKPLAFASGLLQLLRILLKQRIPIRPFDAIYTRYETLLAEGKTLQQIAEAIRSAPELKPRLPVNTCADRILTTFSAELEAEVLKAVQLSRMGEKILVTDLDLLNHIHNDIGHLITGPEAARHFFISKNPLVATLLSTILPGTMFSEADLIDTP